MSMKNIDFERYLQSILKSKTQKTMTEIMQKMIGFRNRAIHNYPSLDEEQLYKILQEDIEDFKEFLELIKSYF